MKHKFTSLFVYPFIILFSLIGILTCSSLLFGASNSENVVETLAISFDKYLRNSELDYVAAEFSSTNPVNPIRKSELNQVSTYQNFWQLSKGPDNSLIRVYSPAYLARTDSVVAPLTLYPTDNDYEAITPIIYTGFDQDFRGDYIDIKVKQLKDKEKQINWSDFYRGGQMENYTSDTHSIMVSEKIARKIYAAQKEISIDSVTDDDIETLVGTLIRSKMTSESGVVEPIEREPYRDEALQDKDLMESEYYNPKFSRVKRIIGILDNKSAEKYKPLIGDEFVFAVPTSFVSYDYFHPVVYGMFKNNLVGNRTSLRFFMAFHELAKKDKDYNLVFCDVVRKDGSLQLVRDGYLQTNFLKTIEFYESSSHFVCSSISFAISLLSTIAVAIYFILLLIKHKEHLKKFSIIFLLAMLGSFTFFLLLFYLIKTFSFIGFSLPTMTIGGFLYLLSVQVLLTIFYLIFTRGRVKTVKTEKEENVEQVQAVNKKLVCISKVVIGFVLGFTIFVLLNVAMSRGSITSVGLPSLPSLIGCAIAVLIESFTKTKNIKRVTKVVVLDYLKECLFYAIGPIPGVIIAALLSQFGFIWVPGIGFTVVKVTIAILVTLFLLFSAFWVVYGLRKLWQKLFPAKPVQREIEI